MVLDYKLIYITAHLLPSNYLSLNLGWCLTLTVNKH